MLLAYNQMLHVDMINPDEERVSSLLRLLSSGAGNQVVISHDSVWCWRGEPIPNPAVFEQMSKVWNPLHFTKRIVPKLIDGGATEEQIEALLVDNPRRFFAGEKLHAIV